MADIITIVNGVAPACKSLNNAFFSIKARGSIIWTRSREPKSQGQKCHDSVQVVILRESLKKRVIPQAMSESQLHKTYKGPENARKLLRLIPNKVVRITSLRDLDEEFPLIVEEHGERYANGWYWWQAICLAATQTFVPSRRLIQDVIKLIGL